MSKDTNGMPQKKMIWTIYTALLGVDGTDDKGLVGDFRVLIKRIDKLEDRHTTLNRKFWMLVAGLVSSGVLGANAAGLLGG